MSTPAKLLLDDVSPPIRKFLIDARMRAMHGDFNAAVDSIDAEIARTVLVDARGTLCLALLKAELSYLEREDQAALDVFESVIGPIEPQFALAERLAVAENRDLVRRMIGEGYDGNQYYDLIDTRRRMGLDWSDFPKVIGAQKAAAEGRHYKARNRSPAD